jgi:ABC-type glycerol-3-phosphate transport system permease component
MIYNFKWYNTYMALIAPFLVSVFSIFLLRQFFMQIPKDLFEAALIDGMGHVRFLTSIVVPLSMPAILTVSLLNFIWSWDNFKWPLLVTRDSSMRFTTAVARCRKVCGNRSTRSTATIGRRRQGKTTK